MAAARYGIEGKCIDFGKEADLYVYDPR